MMGSVQLHGDLAIAGCGEANTWPPKKLIFCDLMVVNRPQYQQLSQLLPVPWGPDLSAMADLQHSDHAHFQEWYGDTSGTNLTETSELKPEMLNPQNAGNPETWKTKEIGRSDRTLSS